MRTTIILRAADPARAAAVARAIGIPLLDPDRLNPDCWHVRTSVTILVTAADGHPGGSFGPQHLDETVSRLEEVMGQPAVRRGSDDGIALAEVEGFEVRLERDAPTMLFRDVVDFGQRFAIQPVFKAHRDEILLALAEIGASNSRLVGPALGRTGGSRRWTLVVDAPGDADIAGVEPLIGRVGAGFAPLAIVRSVTLEPEHLAEIDRYAYDI